jgi:hypothetical protein
MLKSNPAEVPVPGINTWQCLCTLPAQDMSDITNLQKQNLYAELKKLLHYIPASSATKSI